MRQVKTNNGPHNIKVLPDKCPFCHRNIIPRILFGEINTQNSYLEAFLSCPNSHCHKSFVGCFERDNWDGEYFFNGQINNGSLEEKIFSDNITLISRGFVSIYNEAYQAEQYGLYEICGVGYRKALEFLIKDYTISNYQDKKEEIKKIFLSDCINKYVSDSNIKSVAKRAVWLGNDETHYVRKWEGKNLTDLKKLIDITTHWIEMEILTKSFQDEMPD